MRLNIDIRLYNNSGIGRYIKGIVPVLLNMLDAEVILLKNEAIKLDDRFNPNLISFREVKSPYYSFIEQIEIPLRVKKEGLLWIPHYNYPLLSNVPKVVTVHDLAHIALKEMLGSFFKDIYAHTMFRMLRKRVDKVICVSHFTKSELIKYTGIEEKKVRVIYNGLDNSWHRVTKKDNPEDKPYLLYVGNVKPHKNLKILVQAFLTIRDKVPHNLVLVGKKDGFITQDDEIGKLVGKASERIKFTGYISDEKLKQYYAYADVMVFPSLYEGFGYPPLEAMACGCPVIASNIASIPEVCGDAAEYFDPANIEELISKMEKVLFNDDLKQQLIQKGRKQAEKFTVEECANQTAQVLNSFL